MSIMVVLAINTYILFCRSKDFRPAYGRIQEVLALITQGVTYLACTATITEQLHSHKIQI